MFERLQRLLAETFGIGPEQITPGTRIADLVRDSLDLVELTMAVEEKHAASLPPAVAEALDLEQLTVGELAALLERHGREES